MESAVFCKLQPLARSSLWRKQTQYSQIKQCMDCRSSRIYEKVFVELNTNHENHIAGKGVQFDESLQSCVPVHSYAPSDEHPGC